MPPNSDAAKAETRNATGTYVQPDRTKDLRVYEIVWKNVIVMLYFYIGGLYGGYLTFVVASWATAWWCLFLAVIGTLGSTAGAHRLWTHNSYKAKLPLRIMLAFFHTVCFQNSIYEWVRDHRMHHKYTDTDADPHNAGRGFFFSHVGWLLVKKHRDIKEKGTTIYMKDVEADPVVMFQKKYYAYLAVLCTFIMPCLVPWYFWEESFSVAWYTASIFRYIANVNGVWCVNSVAHLYGARPYDKNILPRENVYVGYIGFGEGWHNYHHVFPWDYRASEFNGYLANLTTGFLDLCAKIGWAYDLKSVSQEMVRKRMVRTGENDGKRDDNCNEENIKMNHLWGWGDAEMTEDDKRSAIKKYAMAE